MSNHEKDIVTPASAIASEIKNAELAHAEALKDASRMGRFSIGAGLFTHQPDLVRRVLAWLEFFPHFVSPEQGPPRVDYMGQSPRFERLKQGDMVPEYYVRVRECDDGLAFSIERQDEKRIVVPGR